MRKGNNKRGFIPPQPAAALSALDFAHASEAFRRAVALGDQAKTDADIEATAEVIAGCADRLISIPTQDPANIAVKIEAFAWLTTVSSDMRDPVNQRRIAASDDDKAKGLLAIYLDLSALANGAAGQLAEAYASAETMRNSREWEAALATHDQALLVRDAAFDNEADNDKALDVALAAHTEALETLLNVRAPNIAALVEKARRGINEAYTELLDECADDAETIERLLAEPEWESGSIVAALYQDALALSGDRGPIPSIKCPSFSASAWLDATEAATGARITGAPDGQWALWFPNAASRAAFDGLKRWQREFVISEVMLKRGGK